MTVRNDIEYNTYIWGNNTKTTNHLVLNNSKPVSNWLFVQFGVEFGQVPVQAASSSSCVRPAVILHLSFVLADLINCSAMRWDLISCKRMLEDTNIFSGH